MKESSDSIVTRRCCWLCNIYRYTSDKRWVNRIAFWEHTYFGYKCIETVEEKMRIQLILQSCILCLNGILFDLFRSFVQKN